MSWKRIVCYGFEIQVMEVARKYQRGTNTLDDKKCVLKFHDQHRL